MRRFAVLLALLAGASCAPAAPPSAPPTMAFWPAPGHEHRWLSTPIAVEIACERSAREIEAADGIYLGELRVEGVRPDVARLALSAARHGATHFRIVTGGEETRIDVVLYRVDEAMWHRLPEGLRPAAPAGEAHAAL